MEKSFFDRVDDLLKEQKKTQKDFAKFVGFSNPQGYVTQRTRNSLPRVDMALKMAQFLNTSVEYLVTGEEKKDNSKIILSDLQELIDRYS